MNDRSKSKLLGSAFSILALVATAQAFAQSAPPDREAFHAALQECATQNGITLPERGQRPSESDRKIIDACLQAKGVSPPPHGRGANHGQPPQGPLPSSETREPSNESVVNQ